MDGEDLREYAGRLLQKVQSQARDLQRMVRHPVIVLDRSFDVAAYRHWRRSLLADPGPFSHLKGITLHAHTRRRTSWRRQPSTACLLRRSSRSFKQTSSCLWM